MKKAVFLLAGLALAIPAGATPNVPVKCGANQERVWVYDNLATFDVAARLKCGDSVEALGIEKGYVKIRTTNGIEGYIGEGSVSGDAVSTLAATSVPAPQAVTPPPQARPAPPAIAAAAPHVVAAAPPPASSTVVVVMPPAPPVATPVVAPSASKAPSTPTAAAAITYAAATTPIPAIQHPAPAMATTPKAAVPVPVEVAQQPTKSTIVPPVAPKAIAVQAPAASLQVSAAVITAVAPKPAQPIVATPAATPAVSITAQPVIQKPQPSTPLVAVVAAQPANSSVPAPSAVATRGEAVLTVEIPKVAIAPAPATPAKPALMKAADVMPTRVSPSRTRKAADFYDDDEDRPEAVAAEDLSACNVYFSAYGVTPAQFKWFAGDRNKKFPGVCPAPQPSMVDYVVIFTHDDSVYTISMPEPVHTDRNGFSDWSPVTAIDTTLIPASALDKAHHEYAWVFHVHRGSFDPGKFSAHRRPNFVKTEHGSSKAVEDAFEFITGADVNQ